MKDTNHIGKLSQKKKQMIFSSVHRHTHHFGKCRDNSWPEWTSVQTDESPMRRETPESGGRSMEVVKTVLLSLWRK